MTNDKQSNIKKMVLDRIINGDIKKVPKFVFSIKALLFFLAIIIVSAFVIFLTSFVIYALQVSDLLFLPKFGLKGIEVLFRNLPWLLILLVLFFILILEILVTRYSFAYRRPLLYSSLGIIFLVVIISFFVRQTLIHEKIYGDIQCKESSIVKSFYDIYTKPTPDQFHPGTVLEVYSDSFILENRDKTTITVVIGQNTQIRPELKIYKGGKLLIVGKITDGILQAEAIDNAPAGGRP